MNAPAVHWDIFKQDLRYTARTLTRARGFSLTAILVIALGVGANTAAFSVADFVLVRPLPFPRADDLVRLCEGPRRGGGWGCNNQLSPANYRDFKEMNASFDQMGAFGGDSVNLVGGGEPRRIAITPVTPEVLPVLGVQPMLGRVFDQGTRDAGAAVISYGLWQSQFAGSGDVLGQKINLNGAPYTIVGVMPRGFYFPTRDSQLWTLLAFRDDDFQDRNDNYIEAVGRLKPGRTFEQARADLTLIGDRLAHDHPDTNAETGVSVFRMRDNMAPRFRLMLLSLSGASLCLLLLTCANLANLLIARAAANEREFAVRAALGAGRERLVRQLMTQSAVLTLLGGALGIFIAFLTVPLFSTLVPPTLPVATQPSLDVRMLGVAALFTVLTALGFGVLPALRAGRTGFSALRDGARTGGGRKQRVRAVLVTVQVGVSVVLLISSGLLIRAVSRVQAVDAGFSPAHVVTLRTALPRPKYGKPTRRAEYYDRVLAAVRGLPGVQSAGFTSGLPIVVPGLVTGVEMPGEIVRTARTSGATHRWITPDYFRAMGIPLLRGRDVADSDRGDRPWIAVVSASFVERYWHGQDPLGKTFKHRGQWRTVVGVVGDVKVRGLERISEPQIYLPAAQIADDSPAVFDPKDLVIRHAGEDPPLVEAVRQIVRAADPEQPISNVRPLETVLAGETASRRAQLQVLAVLAVVAILLSGVGIYGLLAYTVAQRSQEIGVRLALGAEPARVGRMIFADGMRLAAFGIVPGVLGAYAAGRSMSALLFGVAPGDPATFATALSLVMLIALIGSAVPALRAVRVTPMSVLKAE
jgi:putative ABC transport system permease protein